MEHTKGKVVFNKHGKDSKWLGNLTIEIGKTEGIMNIRTVACLTNYGSVEEATANAERLVTCCNEHDTLKAKEALLDKAAKAYAIANTPSNLNIQLFHADENQKEALRDLVLLFKEYEALQ